MLERVVDDTFHGGFVRGVELACVDLDRGIEGGEFALVGFEMGRGEVAEVDGAGAVMGELVGGGTADAEGRVGTRYYDNFSFDASVEVVSRRAWGNRE